MKVEIVDAQFVHVINLVEGLRERERLGFARLGDRPEKIITREIAQSFVAYTGLVDGRVVAMGGARVDGILSNEAYIWMLCSDLIDEYPIAFLRHSARVINDLKIYFSRIHGYVVEDFEKSVVWLEWLGFKVEKPVNGLRAFST